MDARRALVLGWSALAVLATLACALIWTWSPGMTILGDEWRYAEWTSARGALDRGFDPDVGKYAIPVPLLVYQGLFELFGLESHVPFRLMALGLLVVVAAAFYELMRRRVGYLAALPAVALILFLGTSTEVLATSLRSPALMSLAAALLALLLLERSTPGRDAAACALLAVSIACHPGGLAFCTAAAVIVLARPAPRLRVRALRAWVFALPLLFFLVALRPAVDDRASAPSLSERALEAPGYLLEGVTGLVARMAGVSETYLVSLGGLSGEDSEIGWLLAAILAAGLVVAFARRRPFPFYLLAFVLGAGILVGAALLAPGGTREPNLERYVLPSAVMLLLAIAELLRNVEWSGLWQSRMGRGAILAGGALFAFAIASNAYTLETRADSFARTALALRAEALGFELARDLDPVLAEPEWDAKAVQDAVGKHRFPVNPGQYYAIAEDFGTPALSVDELATEPEEVRRTTRIVLEFTAQAPIPSELRRRLEGSE